MSAATRGPHDYAERIKAVRRTCNAPVPNAPGAPHNAGLGIMPEIGRLRREVHPDRTRQQDHGCVLVSSCSIAATQLGDTLDNSSTTPRGSRRIAAGSPPITVAGTNVSAAAIVGCRAASRFRHHAIR